MKTNSVTKRLITVLLVISVLFGTVALLASCSDKPTKTTTPSGNEETTDSDTPQYPKFNGEEIRFIVEEGSNGGLTERSIIVDSSSQDIVDTAVLKRNKLVEQTLNVKIVLVDVVNFADGLINKVLPSLVSNADNYDVFGGYRHFTIALAIRGDAGGGYLLNFNKIPKAENHINIEGGYWSKETYDTMSYKGAAYWLTGDIALRYIGGFYVTFVNANLWDSNKEVIKEITKGYDNIHDLVRDGKWTIDVLHNVSKAVYQDKNGNGKPDKDDIFGFTITMQDPTDGIIYGFGIQYTKWEDGKPVLNFTRENSDVILANVKLNNLYNQNVGVWIAQPDDSKDVMEFFAKGQALFTVNKLFMSEIALANMTDNFYVVPVPKLTEKQANYSSALHDGCTMFAIPYTNRKVAATTATLDCMAYYSNKEVLPKYYELALKEKYTRDEGLSAEMIDMVRDSIYTDFIVIWSNSIGNCASFFRSNIGSNFPSRLKSVQESWKEHLNTLVKNLEKSLTVDLRD